MWPPAWQAKIARFGSLSRTKGPTSHVSCVAWLFFLATRQSAAKIKASASLRAPKQASPGLPKQASLKGPTQEIHLPAMLGSKIPYQNGRPLKDLAAQVNRLVVLIRLI